jgi:hypothetical protein
MWKLIFLALIVWLAITLAKRILANTNAPKPEDKPTDNATESMVQCSACQVHLPRSEAFLAEGKFYCSQAHINHKQN